MYRSDLCQSRKALASHAKHGTSSALAALTGAWVQSLVSRSDQPLGWQDLGIGLGLAALWALRHQAKG